MNFPIYYGRLIMDFDGICHILASVEIWHIFGLRDFVKFVRISCLCPPRAELYVTFLLISSPADVNGNRSQSNLILNRSNWSQSKLIESDPCTINQSRSKWLSKRSKSIEDLHFTSNFLIDIPGYLINIYGRPLY